MAIKRKVRRKARRKAPSVRKIGAGPVMVGGAQSGAETDANQMAAGVMTRHNTTSRQAAPMVRRDTGTVTPKTAPGTSPSRAPRTAEAAVHNLGDGRALSTSERVRFEPQFNADLGHVRVHEGAAANRATRALDARAFAYGSDIALSRDARDPDTLAHEMAHVANGDSTELCRDLAIEPTNPDAVARVLTAQERQDALTYNRRRFEDPFTIRIIRDVFGDGISDVPAVIDDDFVSSTLQWQAERNLAQDGMFGSTTTRTMVRELVAEGEGRLARLVRSDNFTRATTVTGPTFFQPAAPHPGNPSIGFEWLVRFTTSLRGGHIIQHVRNEWEEHGAPAGAQIPTLPGYFESWQVNNAGALSPADTDLWRRPARPNTRGRWRMTGRLYTVLNLPSVFVNQGQAGHVPDALALPTSRDAPGQRPTADQLGLPEGYHVIENGNEGVRQAGGEWDFQNADPAQRFNRSR